MKIRGNHGSPECDDDDNDEPSLRERRKFEWFQLFEEVIHVYKIFVKAARGKGWPNFLDLDGNFLPISNFELELYLVLLWKYFFYWNC